MCLKLGLEDIIRSCPKVRERIYHRTAVEYYQFTIESGSLPQLRCELCNEMKYL